MCVYMCVCVRACTCTCSLALVKSLQSCPTLCDPIDHKEPARILCPWNFLGKNTGVDLPPWNLPDPGIEHASVTSPALVGEFFTTSATWEAYSRLEVIIKPDFSPILIMMIIVCNIC